MSHPFTFVQLQSSTATWKIRITENPTGARQRVIVLGTEGLMTPGENNTSPIDRAYSDGSVLAPNPTFSGKDISLRILFHGYPSQIKSDYIGFLTFLKSANMVLTTDFPHSLTVQFQRLNIDSQVWRKNKSIIELTVFLKSKEAW